MAAKGTKVKGRTAILKAKRECGLEMSRLESAYLALREKEALGNAVAGDKIRKLGVEVANNIPFILLLCNIIGLVVILVAVWIPKGEMPYRPLTPSRTFDFWCRDDGLSFGEQVLAVDHLRIDRIQHCNSRPHRPRNEVSPKKTVLARRRSRTQRKNF